MWWSWEQIYDYFKIKDFIYFISSPSIQEALLPVKVVFIFFAAFFFCAVIWFYLNSSYIRYKFLQDTTEFLFHEPFGLRKINKELKKIKKKTDFSSETELKLAIIEADDFLCITLEDAGYRGETFEELMANARKKISNYEEIMQAHALRNAIIYQSDFKLNMELGKKVLDLYEKTIRQIGSA